MSSTFASEEARQAPALSARPARSPARAARQAAWIFKGAAIVTLLYAGLHTYGFQAFRPPTEAGAAVLRSMQTVIFEVHGQRLSYGGFYQGFGLFVGLALALTAVLGWWLSRLVTRRPADCVAPALCLLLFHLGGLALCLSYFSSAPAILSAVTAALLAAAAWCAWRAGEAERAGDVAAS